MTRDGPSRKRHAETGPPSAELTEALDLLRSPRRRFAIDYLDRTAAEVVDLDELAARVREWEGEGDGADRCGESVQEVYNDLYHAHVPRLSAAGVATYEPAEDRVRCEELSEPLSQCLEVVRDLEGVRTIE